MNQVKWACDDAFVLVNYVLCFFLFSCVCIVQLFCIWFSFGSASVFSWRFWYDLCTQLKSSSTKHSHFLLNTSVKYLKGNHCELSELLKWQNKTDWINIFTIFKAEYRYKMSKCDTFAYCMSCWDSLELWAETVSEVSLDGFKNRNSLQSFGFSYDTVSNRLPHFSAWWFVLF